MTSLNAIFFITQNFPSSPESTFSFNCDIQFIQIYCLAYKNCSFIHKVPWVEMEEKKDNLKVILKQQQQITSWDSPLFYYLEPYVKE